MRYIIILLGCLLITSCASKPMLPKPSPIHKLDITWKATENGALLSFEDYNKLGVWLTDVNRYVKDQKQIIQICEDTIND
ncbi:Rz-like spanin [Aeromonas phage Aes012]|uniref:Uncharacterized protein pseT.2 n=8 Tax=Tulanevirus TaxID=2560244 RepID=Q19CH6_9CAUD|nr:Rz-like spanin [Aeromonas phage Aes508]YP_007677912.1 Rz-like spanin [Aeromonas phage Aes012]YP_009613041.1 Rz-like spanin [Aeromonas phage AS-gz]YP_656425.1 Rz-like spanin [Aeromonas phage 25]QSJ03587.1 hypothetical protein [Aeromonas phage vB_AsM_ZHF]UIW12998.1 hypothetical protein Ah13A_062 [Aeromonas phage AhMtk13a]UYD57853.1 hypothetical protein MEIMHGIN_00225 [Aeromonas phage avDM3]UYD57904.1 hypothetical protein GHHBBDOD_00033 [Aeromonas phage avDM4]ABF72749.1 pseT.2 conserved hyp